MVETRRLKNVVIFIQTILNFVLSRKTMYVILMLISLPTRFNLNQKPYKILMPPYTKDVKIAVDSKSLRNFQRILEMPLTICEINLRLACS